MSVTSPSPDPAPSQAVEAKPQIPAPSLTGEQQQIQRVLCLTATDNVESDSLNTREALSDFQGVLGFEQTGILTGVQAQALLTMTPCPEHFLTYYERITFTTKHSIEDLQKQLNLHLAVMGISMQPRGIMDPSTREAVKMVQRRHELRPTSAVSSRFASEILNKAP